MTETREIPGTDGRYKATSDGRIIGPKGRTLKPRPDRRGYLTVRLHAIGNDRRQLTAFVHRLVALAFIPCEHPDSYQINHKDEIKTNNYVSNLEWCTNDYNQHYGTGIERSAQAHRVPVIVWDDRGNIIGDYKSQTEAARRLGIRQGMISSCLKHQMSYNGLHFSRG